MRKLITLSILILCFKTTVKAQSMSCQEAFEVVTQNYDSKDVASCFNSSVLIKAEYYTLDNNGFVVAYIKENDYDFSGSPYLFCGISQQRWSSFKYDGMTSSWGKAYHAYIRDYTCDCY